MQLPSSFHQLDYCMSTLSLSLSLSLLLLLSSSNHKTIKTLKNTNAHISQVVGGGGGETAEILLAESYGIAAVKPCRLDYSNKLKLNAGGKTHKGVN